MNAICRTLKHTVTEKFFQQIVHDDPGKLVSGRWQMISNSYPFKQQWTNVDQKNLDVLAIVDVIEKGLKTEQPRNKW